MKRFEGDSDPPFEAEAYGGVRGWNFIRGAGGETMSRRDVLVVEG